MKVLSYLEWMCNFNKQEASRYQYKLRDKYGFTSVVDFYAQPFKSELITELFEGWVTDKNNIKYRKGKSYLEIDDYYYDFWANTKIGQPIHLYHPRTLDDFICDCQRAGIELSWRDK